MKKTKPPKNFDEYLLSYPENVRIILVKLDELIKKAAPKAEEVISYGMPAFKFHGMLVYFAAHKNHIGLYPMASGISAFKKELSKYKGARGSVQFPYTQPIPYILVRKIVKYRVKENLGKIAKKKLKK